MKKGITAIVSVVLLIAIVVASAISIWFWMGGVATKQPVAKEPISINAVPISNDYVTLTVLIANLGEETIMKGTVLSIAENGVSVELEESIPVGEQRLVSFVGYNDGVERFFPTDKYTIYGARVAQSPVIQVAVPPVPETLPKTIAAESAYGDYNPCLVEVGERIYLGWDTDRVTPGGNYDIFTAWSENGVEWFDAMRISDSQNNKNPSMAYDGAYIGLAWDMTNPSNEHIFTKQSSDGISWSGKIQGENEANRNLEPVVIVDEAGTYVLAWASSAMGNYDIYIKTAGGFLDFSGKSNFKITSSESDDAYPAMIQDSWGMYWIAFQSEREGSGIWVTNSSNRVDWENPRRLPTLDGALEPSLIQDHAGKYWLAYHVYDGLYSHIWIMHSGDMHRWSPSSRASGAGVIERSPFLMQASDDTYWMAFEGSVGENFDIYVKSTTNAMFWN